MSGHTANRISKVNCEQFINYHVINKSLPIRGSHQISLFLQPSNLSSRTISLKSYWPFKIKKAYFFVLGCNAENYRWFCCCIHICGIQIILGHNTAWFDANIAKKWNFQRCKLNKLYTLIKANCESPFEVVLRTAK